MDVDSLVDAWKSQMNVGPKHGRDGTVGLDDRATKRVPKSQRIIDLETTDNPKYELGKTRGGFRFAAQRFYATLDRFYCRGTMNSIATARWLVDHMYECSFTSAGQWGVFIELITTNKSAGSRVLNETFPVYIIDYQMDHRYSSYLGTQARRMPRSYYDFALKTLTELKFVADLSNDDVVLQQDPDDAYFQVDDGSELDAGGQNGDEGGDESAAAGGDTAAGEVPEPAFSDTSDSPGSDEPPDDIPIPMRHEELLDLCLAALPDNINRANEQLSSENHSIFSHSYDYQLQFLQEGGGIQLPEWRSYYYRQASENDVWQHSTEGANRNADIAAALRSLVLWCVVLSEEAKVDAECPLATVLNTGNPKDDPLYETVIDNIRWLHELVLEKENDVATDTADDRKARYLTLLLDHEARMLPLETAPQSDREKKSPLVDLLWNACGASLGMLMARYGPVRNGGLQSEVASETIVAHPTPVFRQYDSTSVDAVMEQAAAEAAEAADPDDADDAGGDPTTDSQETIVDDGEETEVDEP